MAGQGRARGAPLESLLKRVASGIGLEAQKAGLGPEHMARESRWPVIGFACRAPGGTIAWTVAHLRLEAIGRARKESWRFRCFDQTAQNLELIEFKIDLYRERLDKK